MSFLIQTVSLGTFPNASESTLISRSTVLVAMPLFSTSFTLFDVSEMSVDKFVGVHCTGTLPSQLRIQEKKFITILEMNTIFFLYVRNTFQCNEKKIK